MLQCKTIIKEFLSYAMVSYITRSIAVSVKVNHFLHWQLVAGTDSI